MKILISDIKIPSIILAFLGIGVLTFFGVYMFVEEKNFFKFLESDAAFYTLIGLSLSLILSTVFILSRHVGYVRIHAHTIDLKIGKIRKKLHIKNQQIWWNYSFGIQTVDYITGISSTASNRINLWLALECEEEVNIFLNNQLMPWLENPKGVNYSRSLEIDPESKEKYVFYTSGNLNKLFKKIDIKL